MGMYYALDNFSAFSVKLNQDCPLQNLFIGTVPTVEHGYQALKFVYDDRAELSAHGWVEVSAAFSRVIGSGSPQEAKDFGFEFKHLRRADWFDVKLEIMERLLRLKFEQHAEVRRQLSISFRYTPVENSPDDDFWGIAYKKGRKGKNHMGKLWEKIRVEKEAQLRREFPEEFVAI